MRAGSDSNCRGGLAISGADDMYRAGVFVFDVVEAVVELSVCVCVCVCWTEVESNRVDLLCGLGLLSCVGCR